MSIYKEITPVLKELSQSISLYKKGFQFDEATAIDLIKNSDEDLQQISRSYESYNEIIKEGPQPFEKDNERTKRQLKDFLINITSLLMIEYSIKLTRMSL
jgi:hypothetical protein